MALLVRVTPEPDGRWRMMAGEVSERLAEGFIDVPRVQAVHAALRAWEGVKPREVPLPGHDAPFRKAEEDLGRALVRTLGASQQLTQRFAAAAGAARATDSPLVIVMDVEDPTLRQIPWELIADQEDGIPIEAANLGVVLRLATGRVRPPYVPETDGISVSLWCPTPSDPLCAEVAETLEATLKRLDVPPPRRIDPGSTALVTDTGSTVLHIICHGQRDAQEVRLLLGADSAGPPTAAARLAAWIQAADVILLDVCEAGATTNGLLGDLPGRLLACGARAVIAPSRRCSGRAAEAFSRGFYASWAAGRSLAAATAAGRNEVSGTGLGVADSRWYNHVLYVTDTTAGVLPGPIPAFWRPEGWPRPDAGAREFLKAAKELADRDGLGFVGVEHFALALAYGHGTGMVSARIRLLLAHKVMLLERLKRGLYHLEGRRPDLRGTPRLRQMGAHLDQGFTCDDLWTLLALDTGHVLHTVVDSPLSGLFATPDGSSDEFEYTSSLTDDGGPGPLKTIDTRSVLTASPGPRVRGPATALEVIAGPEDGRVLCPAAGEHLGRWGAGNEVAHVLYEGTLVVDRCLHRRFATWLGDGVVVTEAPCAVMRNNRPAPTRDLQEARLMVGDVLVLSRATAVRGIATGPVGGAKS